MQRGSYTSEHGEELSHYPPDPSLSLGVIPPDPFKGGQYEYLEELQAFDRRVPLAGVVSGLAE